MLQTAAEGHKADLRSTYWKTSLALVAEIQPDPSICTKFHMMQLCEFVCVSVSGCTAQQASDAGSCVGLCEA